MAHLGDSVLQRRHRRRKRRKKKSGNRLAVPEDDKDQSTEEPITIEDEPGITFAAPSTDDNPYKYNKRYRGPSFDDGEIGAIPSGASPLRDIGIGEYFQGQKYEAMAMEPLLEKEEYRDYGSNIHEKSKVNDDNGNGDKDNSHVPDVFVKDHDHRGHLERQDSLHEAEM